VQEVHLALRNYADFFAAAYVEYLRSASSDRVIGEARMKRRVLSRMPSWRGFVELVQQSFPRARLILWRHEDFRALSDRVIGNICGPGLDASDLASPKRTRGRPTASHRAVHELLTRINREGGEAALARRVEIQKAYPRGGKWPAYDPWTPEERAHLTRLYDRDVAGIRGELDVTFLEPENQGGPRSAHADP
jgi:hypothetical protein